MQSYSNRPSFVWGEYETRSLSSMPWMFVLCWKVQWGNSGCGAPVIGNPNYGKISNSAVNVVHFVSGLFPALNWTIFYYVFINIFNHFIAFLSALLCAGILLCMATLKHLGSDTVWIPHPPFDKTWRWWSRLVKDLWFLHNHEPLGRLLQSIRDENQPFEIITDRLVW